MSDDRLLSINEAAVELGLHRITVGQLVKSLGIKTVRLPYSPTGKGLNKDDIERIRKAIGKPGRPAKSRQTAAAS